MAKTRICGVPRGWRTPSRPPAEQGVGESLAEAGWQAGTVLGTSTVARELVRFRSWEQQGLLWLLPWYWAKGACRSSAS